MKVSTLKQIVSRTERELEPVLTTLIDGVAGRTPLELNDKEHLVRRARNLSESVMRPSKSELERHIGANDLVDLNYFMRGLVAAKSVCRIILRNEARRQIGLASGFLISPRLVLTNHHVFSEADAASRALAQFEYALDINGVEKRGPSFRFRPDLFFHADPGLDLALVAVSGPAEDANDADARLEDYGALRLNPELGKINVGEYITIAQHPSGLPKQIAMRENQLLSIEANFLVYKSDTAQGSSGSPLFNDTWQVVGLHSAGVPRKNAKGDWLTKDGSVATADTDDTEIDWIGNRGSRASRIVAHVRSLPVNSYLEEFLALSNGEFQIYPDLCGLIHDFDRSDEAARDSRVAFPSGSVKELRVLATEGGARIDLPTGYAALIDGERSGAGRGVGHKNAPAITPGAAVEAYKSPFVETPYSNRRGFDEDFLKEIVEMPTLSKKSLAAKMDNGEIAIPYEHFSLIMNKDRRLAFVTACNIDDRPRAREPEAGEDYTRKGLGELGNFDIEMWVEEPRIAVEHQLPDRFFKNDRKSFDKGHIVRRDDVTWGRTYRQVKRANGDTFHVTNCSPQVAAFNRSNRGGDWGKLENMILKQAVDEKLVVFAGPVFGDNDREFVGEDADGSELLVPIPSRFWKVIIANGDNAIESYGFVLEQDFQQVEWEFEMPDSWSGRLAAIAEINQLIDPVKIPKNVIDADMFEHTGESEILAALP